MKRIYHRASDPFDPLPSNTIANSSFRVLGSHSSAPPAASKSASAAQHPFGQARNQRSGPKKTEVGPIPVRWISVLSLLWLLFSASSASAGGISDDFNTPSLKSFWTFINPLEDSSVEVVGAGTGESTVQIRANGAAVHNLWLARKNVPRIMQPLANTDFEIEAKFNSQPQHEEHFHGLMIEASSSTYLRFDVFSTGTALRLFSASFKNRRAKIRKDIEIPGSATQYLRVRRVDDRWTLSYSLDGVDWVAGEPFTFRMKVANVGLYAGNGIANADHTASVDYYFNNEQPIIPEDPPACQPADDYLVEANSGPGGTVTRSPSRDSYPCGSTVTLTAIPEPNYQFSSWQGDFDGMDPIVETVVLSDISVTAQFEPMAIPPLTIDDVRFTTAANEAMVTWSSNRPAARTLRWGATPSFELGTLTESELLEEHAFVLTGLTPQTTYFVELSVTDGDGVTATESDHQLMTTLAPEEVLSGFVSDEFNRCTLGNEPWEVIDPFGDSKVSIVGAGSGRSHLRIDVSDANNHNAWTVNQAVRVLQSINDTDFDLSAKFDSSANSSPYQMHGMMVEESGGNYVIVELYYDGTNHRAMVAHFTDGAALVEADIVVGQVQYLRIQRFFDTWTMQYSNDSETWTTLASFDHVIAATKAGVFAGNYQFNGVTPANSVLVDYVFTNFSPLLGQDLPLFDSQRTLDLSIQGQGSVSTTPDLAVYSCDQSVELLAQPAPDFDFQGWTGSITSNDNPLILSMAENRQIITQFDPIAPNLTIDSVAVAVDSVSGVATVTWTTNEPASSTVDYGTDATLNVGGGTVTDAVAKTSHSIELIDLLAYTTYFFRATGVNADGESASSDVLSFDVGGNGSAGENRIRSDDFNTCALDTTLWEIQDRLGLGTVAVQNGGAGNAQLIMSIPPGPSYSPWITDNSLAILQSADDTDFVIETKLDSELSQQYQMQGMLVKESESRYLRFEFYSTDTQRYALSATIDNGSASVLTNVAVAPDQRYLRVERTTDLWSLYTSSDGTSWILIDSFWNSLLVEQVGVHAGTSGPTNGAPAHTAIIDYFLYAADPLIDEDLADLPVQVDLVTGVIGNGSVDVVPTAASYSCGENVTLTAHPGSGYEFANWAGDLDGTSNPRTFALVRDSNITAAFVSDITPPVLTELVSATGAYGAEIKISADEPVSYVLAYGTGPTYEIGTVTDPNLSTDHTIVLTDLQPLSQYHWQVEIADGAGIQTTSGDQTLSTTVLPGSGPAGIISDDFNGCAIDTSVWTMTDPLFDSDFSVTGAGTGNAELVINVAGGTSHVPWDINSAPRVMQPATDADFVIEVKFSSELTHRYQMQGLLVGADEFEYLRFDFHHDGTNINAYAAIITPTGASSVAAIPIDGVSSPYWMRVSRVTDQWTQFYSFNGIDWFVANDFAHRMTVNTVGLFAGNSTGGSSPPLTSVIDYFWTDASPAIPEDYGTVGGSKQLTVNVSGSGSVLIDPAQAQYDCGEEVTVTAMPDLGFAFSGWAGDLFGINPIETLVMTDDRQVTASFMADLEPPIISNIELFRGPSSLLVLWDTNEPTMGAVYYGETATYELGSVVDNIFELSHSALIGGLDPALTYHLQIEAEDGAGLIALSSDRISPPGQGPVIDVFYGLTQRFGDNGIAQPWVNILGNIGDEDGVSIATYSINDGPESTLNLGWDQYRLALTGDFNADIPARLFAEGVNEVAIRAADPHGNESLSLISVNFDSQSPAPLPNLIDWSNVASIQNVAQVVDGHWLIDNGALRTLEIGYDRLVAIGDTAWSDYEATVSVTVHSIDPYYAAPSYGPAVGLIARWPGHREDSRQPAIQWWPLGGYAFYRWYENGGAGELLYGDSGSVLDSVSNPPSLTLGTEYLLKIRIETQPDGSSLYQYKRWPATAPEPTDWLLRGSEPSGTDVDSGSLLIVAHHADISVGLVEIQPLSP